MDRSSRQHRSRSRERGQQRGSSHYTHDDAKVAKDRNREHDQRDRGRERDHRDHDRDRDRDRDNSYNRDRDRRHDQSSSRGADENSLSTSRSHSSRHHDSTRNYDAKLTSNDQRKHSLKGAANGEEIASKRRRRDVEGTYESTGTGTGTAANGHSDQTRDKTLALEKMYREIHDNKFVGKKNGVHFSSRQQGRTRIGAGGAAGETEGAEEADGGSDDELDAEGMAALLAGAVGVEAATAVQDEAAEAERLAEERRRRREEIMQKYAAASATASAAASATASDKASAAAFSSTKSIMVGDGVVGEGDGSHGVAAGKSSSAAPHDLGREPDSVPSWQGNTGTSVPLARLGISDSKQQATDAVHEDEASGASRGGKGATALQAPAAPAAPTAPTRANEEDDDEGLQLQRERSALQAAEQEKWQPAHLAHSTAAVAGNEGAVPAAPGSGGGTGLKGKNVGGGGGSKFTFDIFSASPAGLDKAGHRGGAGMGPGPGMGFGQAGGRRALREALIAGEGDDPHLQGNWDDGEGYYRARIGELVGDRYRIMGVVGKGVFSTVLKCVDTRTLAADSDDEGQGGGAGQRQGPSEAVLSRHFVAVKMIRNNDTMRKAAEKERAILQRISEADPQGRRFCVRLLMQIDSYRGHVALVFEYQPMNLREALKKFGRDVGINIGAVRMYGRQLLVALRHLAELRIVHADIKLDNILCSGDLKQVKLCDFGSAFWETDTDNDPTPYLVSRFYRAPEIVLGLQYDRAIDLWSICVCLYELFTGHVMFAGRTNNEMLRLVMAVKGRPPNRLLKAHLRAYEALQLEPHFDADLRFRLYEMDAISNKSILRLVDITGPTRDLAAVLRSSKAGADDAKLVAQLGDLLERGLTLDPAKRIAVADALKHPFFAPAAAHSSGTGSSSGHKLPGRK